MDARDLEAALSQGKVICPAGSQKRVAKIVTVDGVTDAAPADATVKLSRLDGCAIEDILEVTSDSGVTLTFCDAVLNMPKLGFPMSVFLGPTGTISAPRVMRLIGIKDKKAFASHLERLAATPRSSA